MEDYESAALTAELRALSIPSYIEIVRGAPTASQRVEKRKIVTEWNSSPGFNTVEGKAGWFGESG